MAFQKHTLPRLEPHNSLSVNGVHIKSKSYISPEDNIVFFLPQTDAQKDESEQQSELPINLLPITQQVLGPHLLPPVLMMTSLPVVSNPTRGNVCFLGRLTRRTPQKILACLRAYTLSFLPIHIKHFQSLLWKPEKYDPQVKNASFCKFLKHWLGTLLEVSRRTSHSSRPTVIFS